MESQKEVIKRIEAQDFISRFRSKEDFYRYLTQKINLFLPSLHGTKIGFLRAILKEEKSAFKMNEINFMEVPNYPEISVKNLYDEAMQDEEVVIYLPAREQLSNKLPERKFFFWNFKQGSLINILEKPGTGIFLMKEHAKVYRSRKSQQSHNVSKRISEKRPNPDEMNIDAGSGSNRKKSFNKSRQRKQKFL